MKTIFKTIAVAAVFVGIGSTASAQLGAQETMTVNAKILKKITLTNVEDVAFGTVQSNSFTYLDPTDQAGSLNIGSVSNPGVLVIDASQNENIRVEFDESITLTDVGASLNITYVPIISAIYGDKDNNNTDRGNSVLLSKDTRTVFAANVPTATTNRDGRGGYAIISTNEDATDPLEYQKTTLYVGGYLVAAGSYTDGQVPLPTSADQVIIQGTFAGTLSFNVIYQ